MYMRASSVRLPWLTEAFEKNQAIVNNTHLCFSYYDGSTMSAVKRPHPGPVGWFCLQLFSVSV